MAAKENAEMLRKEWRLIVNSFPTTATSGKPILIHWCEPVVCGCKSEKHSRERLHKLMLHVNYRHRPPRPEMKEWTRVRDCLRFHNLGHLTGGAMGGILPLVFEIATAARAPGDGLGRGGDRGRGRGRGRRGLGALDIVPAVEINANAAVDLDAPIPASKLFEETEWRKMVGMRVSFARREVMQFHKRLSSVLKGLLLEAVETLSEEYLKCEYGLQGRSSPFPLMDWLWMERSPANVALQFFGAVLCDGHRATQLLYFIMGVLTFRQAMAHHHEQTHHIRTTTVRASQLIWMRHVYRFFQWPWLLTVTADDRRPALDKDAVIASFHENCEMCFDEGHGRKVKQRIGNAPRDLCLPMWQDCHRILARVYSLNNDASERKHAQHKATFGPHTRWDYFMARSLLQGAQSATKQRSHSARLDSRTGTLLGHPDDSRTRATCNPVQAFPVRYE